MVKRIYESLVVFGAHRMAWTADRYITDQPIIVSSCELILALAPMLGRRINSNPLEHPVYLTYDVVLPLETRAIFRQ